MNIEHELFFYKKVIPFTHENGRPNLALRFVCKTFRCAFDELQFSDYYTFLEVGEAIVQQMRERNIVVHDPAAEQICAYREALDKAKLSYEQSPFGEFPFLQHPSKKLLPDILADLSAQHPALYQQIIDDHRDDLAKIAEKANSYIFGNISIPPESTLIYRKREDDFFLSVIIESTRFGVWQKNHQEIQSHYRDIIIPKSFIEKGILPINSLKKSKKNLPIEMIWGGVTVRLYPDSNYKKLFEDRLISTQDQTTRDIINYSLFPTSKKTENIKDKFHKNNLLLDFLGEDNKPEAKTQTKKSKKKKFKLLNFFK